MAETRKRRLGYLVIVAITVIATVGVLMLLQNIWTRKREAEEVVFTLVPINETVVDPAQWGKNFPRQYDQYQRTVGNTTSISARSTCSARATAAARRIPSRRVRRPATLKPIRV